MAVVLSDLSLLQGRIKATEELMFKFIEDNHPELDDEFREFWSKEFEVAVKNKKEELKKATWGSWVDEDIDDNLGNFLKGFQGIDPSPP